MASPSLNIPGNLPSIARESADAGSSQPRFSGQAGEECRTATAVSGPQGFLGNSQQPIQPAAPTRVLGFVKKRDLAQEKSLPSLHSLVARREIASTTAGKRNFAPQGPAPSVYSLAENINRQNQREKAEIATAQSGYEEAMRTARARRF